MKLRRLSCSGALLLAALAASAKAAAQPGTTALTRSETAPAHSLRWNSNWRRMQVGDYVQTVVTFGGFAYLQLFVEQPTEPKVEGEVFGDGAVRSALRAETRSARENADSISDALWLSPQVLVYAESALIPLVLDNWNTDIAWQLTAMNLQAGSVNALLTRAGHRLIGRERPDVNECEQDPEYSSGCFRGAAASFPSGHTSGAAVAAGLACAHHTHLPLYGGTALDVAACAVLSASALGSGFARIIADRHYISDVVAGAVIGFGSGFGMPMLLHYHWPFGGEDEALRWTLTPAAFGDSPGLAAYGWF